MRACLITQLSKRLTIPRLSPTHTSSRIVRLLSFPNDSVESYDPIMILECSSDLRADPADRVTPDEKLLMFIETCDEGVLKDLNDHGGNWIDVGTSIGIVDDGDPVDGDWLWEAYLHNEED
uniref:Uncharacterized protein n=1 Tax=Eucampia antarctica TaxID=49252 RepID=A0A7S2WKY4_9STRA|mmetsp:Transcript_455/g.436  ORF Transcript_455/g.436 Transcript_455/m.436 type:complete len:121 (+) Transcript_455:59-421(+)|eukprot:CAMPEP_0197833802 /NCGR_PEP_ID=MMETSP1437-20131217/20148_1 /TAXON_ID=49252 ORGANISM="Eucampia antarctica, Strain CCMP1452" /NCGR_SAMPLE_ID=MMETSP1437 /ASSEMBLY_ACC=CAM_ASM_001096 /LENGTH=120 /DNA_ID=CAMNT_0043438073 /DNA_START=53 /DNA_END=415 /DNA_ORIENTATION=+